jgi:hypothetical protein
MNPSDQPFVPRVLRQETQDPFHDLEEGFGKWLLAVGKDVVRYPFRKDGWMILLPGAAFWPLIFFAMAFPFLTSGILVVLAGYLAAYFFEIVAVTIAGKDAPPEWPELDNFLDCILVPALRIVFLALISLLPAILLDEIRYDRWDGLKMHWGLQLFAAVYFPFGCMALALIGSVYEILPHRVLPSILRGGAASIPLAAGATAGECVWCGMEKIAEYSPEWLAIFMRALTAFYLFVMYARIIGLTCRRYRERLGLG